MRRWWFPLLLGLAAALLVALFPSVAEQTVRVQAFGWVLETKQGPLIAALVVLMLAWRLARMILAAVLAGPGRAWEALRFGVRSRREAKLREAVARWINEGAPLARDLDKRMRGTAPSWLLQVLAHLSAPADGVAMPPEDADPLIVAAAAWAATNPHAPRHPDPEIRRRFLERWLAAFPDAAIAHERLAMLAAEEGDWATAERELGWLEAHGVHARATLAPSLVRAWLEIAKRREGKEKDALYARVLRVDPTNVEAALAHAAHLRAQGEARRAEALLLDVLARTGDMRVARAVFETAADKARLWKQLAKQKDPNPAQAWLAAMCAREAGLAKVAKERMQALAETHDLVEAWHALAEWAKAEGDEQQACALYARALAACTKSARQASASASTSAS